MIYMALETRFPNMSVIEDPLSMRGELLTRWYLTMFLGGREGGRFIIGQYVSASVGASIGSNRRLGFSPLSIH